MLPAWAAEYVGLPFLDHGRSREGLDCWGLARLVLMEHYGIRLPDFGDLYGSSVDRAIAGAFEASTAEHDWVRHDAAREGDVVLLTTGGVPMHCGLVIAPPYMLHARPKVGSCVESYERAYWSRRIGGFYRPRVR